MAHELTVRVDGRVEMAYLGETPWHGLGQQLQGNETLEQLAVAAGMDWRIQRSKVRYFADAQGQNQLELPDHHVLFRSDTKAALGLVSAKYKTVQPKEVLEFFQALTEANAFTLETAGTLFGGKRFWALAKMGEFKLAGVDAIKGYLLLSTSCDGSLATTGRFTSVRVVCNNTLSMATAKDQGKAEITIRHSTRFDAEKARGQLGCGAEVMAEFRKAATRLAAEEMDKKAASDFLKILLQDETTKEDVRESRAYRGIMQLFQGEGQGSELVTAYGTSWGMVNAVTEYVDHHGREAKSESHQVTNSWFGAGADLKSKAFMLALQG